MGLSFGKGFFFAVAGVRCVWHFTHPRPLSLGSWPTQEGSFSLPLIVWVAWRGLHTPNPLSLMLLATQEGTFSLPLLVCAGCMKLFAIMRCNYQLQNLPNPLQFPIFIRLVIHQASKQHSYGPCKTSCFGSIPNCIVVRSS